MKTTLKKHIMRQGAISFFEYMSLCLYHPTKGYYTKQDPLSRSPDFVTAPQISQMFGEMIGAWLLDVFLQKPYDAFNIVELGPGAGTCMSDIMRTAQQNASFLNNKQLFLYEVSSTLRTSQEAYLKSYNPSWIKNLSALPDQYCFFFANEFFDALPIRQFRKFSKTEWKEAYVSYDESSDQFVMTYQSSFHAQKLPSTLDTAPENSVFELNEMSYCLFEEICLHLQENGGTCLFIDYGQWQTKLSSTLRAFSQHQIVDPLHEPGAYDITANVVFSPFAQISKKYHLTNYSFTTQGSWLQALGIHERMKKLVEQNPDKQKPLEYAYHYLTDDQKMGIPFKVFAISSDQNTKLKGFARDAQ